MGLFVLLTHFVEITLRIEWWESSVTDYFLANIYYKIYGRFVFHDFVESTDDQYIKYDIYELPEEDRQFFVMHFYERRRVDGFRDDYSLGQLTTDLSGTIAVSLGTWDPPGDSAAIAHFVSPGNIHENYLHIISIPFVCFRANEKYSNLLQKIFGIIKESETLSHYCWLYMMFEGLQNLVTCIKGGGTMVSQLHNLHI